MKRLRTASTGRLLGVFLALVLVAVAGAAIALAAGGGGPVPPVKPLAAAVHDALAAPPVEGVTARITFRNRLIDSGSLQGSNPILSGASGRLWATADHLRLELQSHGGDAQIVVDGRRIWVYDASSNTVYRGLIPRDRGARHESRDPKGVPSVAKIERALARLMRHVDVSGATPTDVAGRPTYTVRVGPKRDGGLLDAAELAWDAARGIPLRAAVYARGSATPVLELEASHISSGPVKAADVSVEPPPGAKVVNFAAPDRPGHRAQRRNPRTSTGVEAVSKALPFALAAPDTLAGRPRSAVRLVRWKGQASALVTYGQGLGGIAVLEQAQRANERRAPRNGRSDHGAGLKLPTVSVNGASAEELKTALGTLIRFRRGGVAYTVVGSVSSADAEAAARGL